MAAARRGALTQLEKEARVKTYLPVPASSRVKHILNERKLNERGPHESRAPRPILA